MSFQTVTKLVELSPAFSQDGQKKQEFISSLLTFARENGWLSQLGFWSPRLEPEFGHDPNVLVTLISEARAFFVASDGCELVVFNLREYGSVIPGGDWQTLILCTTDGHFLDKLSCKVSSRLTRMYVPLHQYQVDVRVPTADDPTQLVIRLIPGDGTNLWGNYGHEIAFGGYVYRFSWEDQESDTRDQSQPSAWDLHGLCRLAIKNDRFHVTFPSLSLAKGIEPNKDDIAPS